MPPKIVSRPAFSSTDITGKADSFQVMRLDMISDGHGMSFLSTDFANISLSCSVNIIVCTLLHQRFHLFIKSLQVPWYKVLNVNFFCCQKFAKQMFLPSTFLNSCARSVSLYCVEDLNSFAATKDVAIL